MPNFNLQQILIRILVLTLSLSVHEYAHARVAYELGDDTAARQGRLTLNPATHIDPLGAIAFILAGFGWAKPVPVNPARFSRDKVKTMRSGMMRVAIAGPISNLIISFIANVIFQLIILIIKIIGNFSLLNNPIFDVIFAILNSFIYSNIFLAIFNMLPIPPLDGSRVLGAFLSDRAYAKYMQFQRYSFIIMFALIFLGGGILSRIMSFISIPVQYVILYPVNVYLILLVIFSYRWQHNNF